MCQLIKHERVLSEEEKAEARLWELWLMYGRAPATPTAPDEAVDLGEIGETKLSDQRINRWCPYSIAEGVKK
jgi:hypothetical protein